MVSLFERRDYSFHFLKVGNLREGEALIVAKAVSPFSRSSPPGHAAVMRYGMCNCIGSVLYSAVLAVTGEPIIHRALHSAALAVAG